MILEVISEKLALKLSVERMFDWMEDRIEHLQWRAPLRPSNKLEHHAFVEKDTFRDESSSATATYRHLRVRVGMDGHTPTTVTTTGAPAVVKRKQ